MEKKKMRPPMEQEDHDKLISIEGKIDTLINIFSGIKSDVGDHETRVRDLEKTVFGVKAAGGILAVLVGIIEPIVLFWWSKGQ
jgi:hypothetical protein